MTVRRPRGVTLVELLVVLVLLGIFFGVTGLALASLARPRESAFRRRVAAARAQAIRTGVPVAIRLDSLERDSTSCASGVADCRPSATDSGPPPTALFLPDGRALGAGFDPLTGALHAAR